MERKKKKIKILIVDSNENLRKQMVRALKTDYQLFEAENKKEALEYLEREKRPTVVLLDLYLPPKPDFIDEGFKVLEIFKEKGPEVKVIIVTTNSQKETISKARQLGADDYVVKPFRTDFLKSVIEQAILKPIPLGVERRGYWRDKRDKHGNT